MDPLGWRLGGENPRKLVEKDILQILRANTLRFRKGAHRIGLSVVRAGSRTWALAVVITEDMVTLAPFDRQVKPGSQVTLNGRLHANWGKLRLYGFSGPQRTFSVPIDVQADRSFRVSFQVPEIPGVYAIGLEAKERRRGRSDYKMAQVPVASFELAVGVPVEAKLSYPPRPDRVAFDVASGEQGILQQLNAARTKRGLNPLVVDPEWVSTARALARETRTRKQRRNFELVPHLPESHETMSYSTHWGTMYVLKEFFGAIEKNPSRFHLLMAPEAHAVAIGLHNKPNKDGDDVYRYGILVLTKKDIEVKKDTPTPSISPQSAE